MQQQGALRAAEPDVRSNRRRITPAMLVEDTRRLCRILYWKHIGKWLMLFAALAQQEAACHNQFGGGSCSKIGQDFELIGAASDQYMLSWPHLQC